MEMVVINNIPWAVGLNWALNKPQKFSRAELLEEAAKLGPDANFDMAARRNRQYGFGSSGGRVEAWENARSLAAFVRLPSSAFLGMFALRTIQGETVWWVFGRNNGRNIGMGDFVGSREKAEKKLADILGLLGDQFSEHADKVICATPEESLAWLSPLLRVGLRAFFSRRGRLTPLYGPTDMRPALYAGVVACAIIGAFAVNSWLNRKAEQEAVESRRLANLSKEQRLQDLLAHPEEHFVKEWISQPLAEDVAISCSVAMNAVPLSVNGWRLDSTSCSGKTLSVSWAHQPGADFIALPEYASLRNPQSAVARIALPGAAASARADHDHASLLSTEYAMRALYQICQVTGTKLRLNFKPAEKRVVEKDKVELVAPWVKGEWELLEIPAVLMIEPGLSQVLSEIPGLTLDSIVFKNDLLSANWTFKGRIYAKRN